MRDTSFAKCFSLSFSLHLLWKRTRSSDHSPLWIKCSRHPDSETTQHAHIAPTVQQSFPATLCPRDQEKQSKAHTNRCNTSFVVTKQTRAPGDSRRVNNVRHFVTHAHTHQPRLSVQPNRLHMVRRHWKNRRRGRRAVWQQLRVLKNKNNAKSLFHPTRFVSTEHVGRRVAAHKLLLTHVVLRRQRSATSPRLGLARDASRGR